MVCPHCSVKFKEKFAHKNMDGITVCPSCGKLIVEVEVSGCINLEDL